jgi:hypothetical protein
MRRVIACVQKDLERPASLEWIGDYVTAWYFRMAQKYPDLFGGY